MATSEVRGRPKETAGIGQRFQAPEIDLVAMATAQGFLSPPPVRKLSGLPQAIREGIAAVKQGKCYFIDVRITPDYLGFPH